jgi:hypothetical protein
MRQIRSFKVVDEMASRRNDLLYRNVSDGGEKALITLAQVKTFQRN